MLSPLLTDVAGMTGVVVYLLSYGLLQSGRLCQGGCAYPTLNLLAASMVLISLSADFNLASALIQVSWILISLVGLKRLTGSRTQTDVECAGAAAGDRSNPGSTHLYAWSPITMSQDYGPTVS